MNIVFMGTPDFAVPCLKALVESGETVSDCSCCLRENSSERNT